MAAMHSSAPLASFPEHYHALIAFVARRVGNRQTAQDLVHDAWLRMAEHDATPGRSQSAGAAPRAYLYTVTEHLVIDHLRRAQRTAERFDAHASQPEGLALDVADACSHREALAAVDAALAALPERCRAIFLADRLDELPQAEIAARHGVSVKTVEREVMRAMDAIEVALHRWRGEAAVARPRAGRRRALSALLGVAGLSVGATQAWRLWHARRPMWRQALATRRGHPLTQPLPDGSTLVLDALSRVEVRYDGARRHVRLLAGSAFFAVARDADKPFVVEAAGARITVLGTRFEVAVGDGGEVRVAVEQGRVRVEGQDGRQPALELGAHEALRWPPGGAPRREATQGDVAGWRSGWLDFRHEPLGDAVRRIARYSTQAMRVAPDAAALPVFGRVRIADADAWLRLLPRSLPVSVREEGHGAQRTLVIARR